MEIELRDIHLPSPISWWPPAPGWWITIAIGTVILIFAFVIIRKIFRPTLHKQALILLRSIESNYAATDNHIACLTALSVLLRRVAISKNPLDAGLTGERWLQHLDKTLGTTSFSTGPGKILLKGPYQPTVTGDEIPHLISLCRKYLEAK